MGVVLGVLVAAAVIAVGGFVVVGNAAKEPGKAACEDSVAVRLAASPDIAPAVGPDTTILPLLNGMAHLERVNARFGRHAVLGGIVRVVTTVEFSLG